MTKLKHNRHEKGFSLLETIVALAILAFAMSALFENFSGSLKATRTSDRHLNAKVLASSLLNEFEGHTQAKFGSKKGEYEGYKWSVKVAPAKGKIAQSGNNEQWTLYNITVEVFWEKNGRLQLSKLKLGKINE